MLYNIRKVKRMSKKKTKPVKNNIKCTTCEFYEKETDFCREKEIENCTKQPNTDFSQCNDFIIKESLVMF